MTETDDATAALNHLAADLVLELGAAKAAEILELAGGSGATALGGTDEYGKFHPAPPPQHRHPALSHLISGGADMSHTIAGGQYMGHTLAGMARGHRPAAAPQEPSGGQQEATPAPQLPEAELDARHMYEAARGASGALSADLAIAPEAQPGMPGSPKQPARRPLGRYGRRRARWR